MQKRRLGNTDMEITPLGLGTWAIGGGNWSFGWGPQDDADSLAAIHKALDLGINWIDTAAAYGLGHSEEIVGRAVRERGPNERPYIFTKCSLVWDETSNGQVRNVLKADSIRREAEASLRRLGVEVIDLYQIHWPVPDEDIEEGWSTLAELQRAGKVRYIGVSNFDVRQMERARAIAPISSLQPPYSLIHREIEAEILPYCQEHNIGVIVYSPMASGLLTGRMTKERVAALPDNDWRKRHPDFQEPRLSRNLALAKLLEDIGYRYGRTAGEVAIAWTLRHPAVTGAIVGARRPEQISEVIGAAEFRLSPSDLEEIENFLRANP
ncbi:aldo/keto reductase [Thermogemmatispora sp.]|uniref:aldo/keto reductase n=1 Tax=Thermogemmatispora sp. TaxID=1968838 RepID=UPI001D503266|nr:aldo/keto reductase [Thermogemmatispora sp.]MBX5450034.1 aldo/keto reductase [Thermogemmatispora sp.]